MALLNPTGAGLRMSARTQMAGFPDAYVTKSAQAAGATARRGPSVFLESRMWIVVAVGATSTQSLPLLLLL